jgi:hypothetical protein
MRCRRQRGARVTARQMHGRHHVNLGGMGLARGQHGGQRLDGDEVPGTSGHPPRHAPVAGDDREHRLPEVVHHALGQDGIVAVHDGADVVDAGDVRRREDRRHAGQGAQALDIDRHHVAVGHRRQAQRCVQRAFQFENVVGVGRLAGHVKVRRLVGAFDTHLRRVPCTENSTGLFMPGPRA